MIEPNQFTNGKQYSMEEAMQQQKPMPPWKQKLYNDLKPTKNSSGIYVPGITEPLNDDPVLPARNNRRKWVNIILVPVILIHWFVVLLQNLMDVISDSIQEIILALENFIRNDAQTKHDSVPPSE